MRSVIVYKLFLSIFDQMTMAAFVIYSTSIHYLKPHIKGFFVLAPFTYITVEATKGEFGVFLVIIRVRSDSTIIFG